MVNSPSKTLVKKGLVDRQSGSSITMASNSPVKRNGGTEDARRGVGLIGQGSKRKIWAVGSKSYDYASFGSRHLIHHDDDEASSSSTARTSAYSSSVEAGDPAEQPDRGEATLLPPPPPLAPSVSSDSCEESNSGGHWTCVACTFVNTNPDFLSCEICSQSRTEEPDDVCPLKGRLTPTNRDKYAAQQTCIQVQKEKIAQVQERALLDERMKEIIEMQQQLLLEIEEEQQNSNNDKISPSSLSREASERSLQEAQTKIDDLHEELIRERSDQVHVELQLRVSQRNLFQQQQQEQGAQASSSSEMTELLEQERMLRSWKDQWEERRESLTQITEFQKELEDTFSRAFA
jgi:hypothetical protein